MKALQEIVKQNLLKTKDSSRIFHGRGRRWPGLEHIVIDYFSPNILITLFKEYDNLFINDLVEFLKHIPELAVENILLQKRYLPRPELIALIGIVPIDSEAVEGGSKYHLKFGETQNIGFFLDMAPGRERLEQISKNKKVLNLFSYTCSLSVAALKGGALGVTNIDMSKAALLVGTNNHLLNGLDLTKARFMAYDIMKSWNKIYKYGPYDIIIIDPPTNQGDSFKVERDYHKIIKRLNEMTYKDAVVMACLNSPHLTSQYIIELFKEHAPDFTLQEVIYSGFMEMESNPEDGLKIMVLIK